MSGKFDLGDHYQNIGRLCIRINTQNFIPTATPIYPERIALYLIYVFPRRGNERPAFTKILTLRNFEILK